MTRLLPIAAVFCVACAREDVELAPPVRERVGYDASIDAGSEPRDAGDDSNSARDASSPSEAQLAHVFDRALCACSSATIANALSIDAFDSDVGTYVPGQSGADVGIVDQLVASAAIDVRGAMLVSGSGFLPIATGPFHVEGDFETNASLTITASDVRIGGDLRVNGDIVALSRVRIEGDVIQSSGHTRTDSIDVAGSIRSADFVVPRPCACDSAQLFDVSARVSAALSDNDNSARGVSRAALHTSPGSGTVELACGRYVFSGGNILANTAVQARGSLAIYVSGDLIVRGKLATELRDDVEVDMFVDGNLALLEGAEIGSPARPAAVRFYVSGEGELALTGPVTLAANVYAPRTSVSVVVDQTTYGALFVNAYQSIASHVLHYDGAIARAKPGAALRVCNGM
jgi:hypothetical protein